MLRWFRPPKNLAEAGEKVSNLPVYWKGEEEALAASAASATAAATASKG